MPESRIVDSHTTSLYLEVMACIGLDLGGTKLAGGVFDESGNLLDRRILNLDRRAGSDVGALIGSLLRNLLTEAGRRSLAIRAVGVSVPGIAHSPSGRVWAPNIPAWDDYPLLDELTETFHREGLKIAIDSDRACSILGEHWKGAARGCTHAIYLAVGTGIGAGILIDGRILRGAQDIAGAAGWMSLRHEFRGEYISCGCFEHHASGEGISKVARRVLGENPSYRGALSSKSPDELVAADVFSAFDAQDAVARETIAEAVQAWGSAAANLVSLFNPERIIFGGGVFGPALRFLDDVRREASKWAQPISMKSVQFVPSELGGDAPLYGAAFLALQDTRSRASS